MHLQPPSPSDIAAAEGNPADDPAQAEWERTEALDEGASESDLETTTATGRDPDEILDPEDEIPFDDLHDSQSQPETQGSDPAIADMGDRGEGDLAPEDV